MVIKTLCFTQSSFLVKKEIDMIQEALSMTFASQAQSRVSNTKPESRLNIK